MPSSAYTVRQAAVSDAQAVFEVHQASVHALCASAYTAEHIRTWFHARTPEIYRPALEAGHIWLAEHQGRVVGFVGAEPGEVTLLFVSPDATGRGLGRQLFELGLSMAARNYAERLTVVATKNSVAFYQQYGFEFDEEQAFIRGPSDLRYPVVKLVQREKAPCAATQTDA